MAPFAIFLQFFTVYMHPLCSERTMWHHVPWCPLGKCILHFSPASVQVSIKFTWFKKGFVGQSFNCWAQFALGRHGTNNDITSPLCHLQSCGYKGNRKFYLLSTPNNEIVINLQLYFRKMEKSIMGRIVLFRIFRSGASHLLIATGLTHRTNIAPRSAQTL